MHLKIFSGISLQISKQYMFEMLDKILEVRVSLLWETKAQSQL